MENLRTNIDNHGKVLIPVKFRKELNFKKGDILVVRRINNELRLISLKSAIKDIQDNFKSRSQNNVSAVDEFLQLKKEDFALEEGKFKVLDENYGKL